MFNSDTGRAAVVRTIALLGTTALFVLLRLAGWLNGPELENHDSVGYLRWAEVFRSADLAAIAGLDPDAAPLFPLLTALLSVVTGNLEAAARLVSLLASVATMIAVYRLTRRIGSPLCGIFAMLLLALSTEFMRVSYAVLTEPLYIALFTWIAYLFLARAERPSLSGGALLGALAGLAFLTRVEAILLMAALPALHLVYLLVVRRRDALIPAVRANLLFVLVMALLAAPQIVRVSAIMDSFALNGRSAWTLILSHPDGKSYDEKLWGLDYDPHTRNLEYLQAHPSALQNLVQDTGYGKLLRRYSGTAVRNLRAVLEGRLVELVSLPLAAFSVVGFLALIRAGRSAEALLLVAFLGLALVAPMLYQVTLRHLLILVPILCILAAPGIVEAADLLTRHWTARQSPSVPMRVLLLAGVILLPAAGTTGILLGKDNANVEYDERALREPVAIVRQHSGQPTIVARKSYLAHLSGAAPHLVPYTDLAGLLTYLEAHPAEFLFFEESQLRDYPFAREIDSTVWLTHFHRVWRDDDAGRLTLYAVR